MMRPALPSLACALLVCAACASSRSAAPGVTPAKPQTVRERIVTFAGACDASGAVPLEGARFLVGDDEDNILRVYDGDQGGPPLRAEDVSSSLVLEPFKKRPPEADIEAATELDGVSYFLTSHGRTSSGKESTARFQLFGTRMLDDGTIVAVGTPYTRLLEDLLATPALSSIPLKEASQRIPKDEQGLNIEGMTSSLDGRSILIGLRSPLVEGKALVVQVENPRELLDGAAARVTGHWLVELDGGGVRSISSWRGRYLLIGGSTASGGRSRLYSWDGRSTRPELVADSAIEGLNPEAFVTHETSEQILLLSDDGTALIDGVECKRLKDPTKKRFRGVWVRVPETTQAVEGAR